jgi:hypothetical protein
MVAARNALLAEGGGSVQVDAVVGRQNDSTLDVLQRYRDEGTLAGVQQLIVHIGTNGPFTQKQFDRLVVITADVPDVVVVNVRVPKSWESASNRVIADNVPNAAPRLRIADWHEASGHPGVVGKDGVHPTPSGAKVYARLALAARPEPPPPPPEEPPPAEEPPPETTTTTAPPSDQPPPTEPASIPSEP